MNELPCYLYNNPFFQDIYNRLHRQNKNALVLIYGPTGSGKSYVGLKICHDIDPNFNISQVIHDPKEFFELLGSDELKKGSAILFDEVGTTLAARRWYSFNNFIINNVLQTFRYRNLLVVFTVPSISFVDKNARKLIHYDIETQGINRREKTNILKIARLSWSDKTEKFYRKYYRKNKKRINLWRIKLVKNRKLINQYEKKSSEFKRKVEEEGLAQLIRNKEMELMPNRQEQARQRREEIIKEIMKRPIKFRRRERDEYGIMNAYEFSQHLIEAKFNISEKEAKRVIAVCDELELST